MRNSQTEEHFSIDESFPEEFADELSRREVFNKHLFRPNTYLHKWWARRCGSTFRTILKQFASDAASRDYYRVYLPNVGVCSNGRPGDWCLPFITDILMPGQS
ncbi:MAG: hypothetical protein GY801_20480 [bacterium]|nr:hypothetical protein [bacterium]